LANGADAVYFGLDDFNARRRAANFTLAELPEVVRHVHHLNAKAYVTLNTLVFADELPAVAKYVRSVAAAGADAVIVQDLGLARLIRCLAPTLEIHASTQTTQTQESGIECLRSLGFDRVILARELALPEIERVRRAAAVPLEVFVHGAICISYSGQCLASESLWGRSANRGLCAQACRLPYRLIVDGQVRDLEDRQYLLSAQDLSAWDRIRDLVALGIAAFKIEGRLKTPQYVAAAVRLYRAAVDAAVRARAFSPSPQQQQELTLSFSRGLCHGFLDGVNQQQLVHGRFPKNRGLLVGEVVAKTPRGIVVELTAECPIKPGDGVVFDEGRPDQDEQGGRVYTVNPAPRQSQIDRQTGRLWQKGTGSEPRGAGAVENEVPRGACPLLPQTARGPTVELTFGRDDLDVTAVSIGGKVWKTDDPAVRRSLESSQRQDRPFRSAPLSARVEARAGQALTVRMSDGTGHEAAVAWEGPLQPAKKHPLTTELLREQFSRLGGTPFELAALELHGETGLADSLPVMVPKSVLNDLRRRGVEALLKQREASHRHAVADAGVLDGLREEIRRSFAAEPSNSAATHHPDQSSPSLTARGKRGLAPSRWHLVPPKTASREVPVPFCHGLLSVLVRSPEQLESVLDWAASAQDAQNTLVYCDLNRADETADAVRRCRTVGRRVGVAAPRVLMPGEVGALEAIASLKPDMVLVRNLGSLAYLPRRHPDLVLVGDHSLNAANDLTACLLLREGLRRVTPSHDLNWQQLRAMLAHVPPSLLEVVVHQHVPMLHTRHCLYAANLSKATACTECDRPCMKHELKLRDRSDRDHPVLVDQAGRNTIFNAAAQTAIELIPEMVAAGLRCARIELLLERAADVAPLLDVYAAVFNGKMTPAAGLRAIRAAASTPVGRGTFDFA
jgi:putative protease